MYLNTCNKDLPKGPGEGRRVLRPTSWNTKFGFSQSPEALGEERGGEFEPTSPPPGFQLSACDENQTHRKKEIRGDYEQNHLK